MTATDLGDIDILGATVSEHGPDEDMDAALVKARVKSQLFNKPSEPTRIGRFVLIKLIGSGAMGEVYTAYDEQLDRKVAIKLVRPELHRKAPLVSVRLLREAQTLARISHPNVVQVYEAGFFRGRVFLAMEFIPGITLRQWLEAQAKEPEPTRTQAILDKLIAAGRGLQAAHSAGLTHRDFKPENVLVGHDGRVCVADFGVAGLSPRVSTKALEPLPEEEADEDGGDPMPALQRMARLTVSGAIMGTPAYMSPEQLGGRPTDDRSDQFSFCVVLYEAIWGQRPFAADDLLSLKEVLCAGAPAEPPHTSDVPVRIWKVLARGLASDPADRYPDMGALLDALERGASQRRWLQSLAIMAAASVVVGVGIAIPVSRGGEDPCSASVQRLAAMWSPAAAEDVHRAFVATGAPYAETSWLRARDRLDAYVAELGTEQQAVCLDAQAEAAPVAEPALWRSVCLEMRGRHLATLLDRFQEADTATVEQSLRMVMALPRVEDCRGSDIPALGPLLPRDPLVMTRVAEIRERLAEVWVQHLSNHPEQAMRAAKEQLDAARMLGYAPLLAEALHRMGLLWLDAGDAGKAETTLLEAVDLAESHRYDELAADVWIDLVNLAQRAHSDMSHGHRWARRALVVLERIGDRGRRRANALIRIGALYFREGKLREAERHQREAIGIAGRNQGDPLILIDGWLDLANTLAARARLEEARQAYQRALALGHAELGDEHPRLAALRHDFGTFLRECGELEEARVLLESARNAWVERHGPMHHKVGDAHVVLANLELQAGALDAARNHALAARAIYEQALAADHKYQATPEMLLGDIYLRGGQPGAALSAHQRAFEIQRRSLGSDHLWTILSHDNIGHALVALGRHDEALAIFDEVERALEGIGNEHPTFAALPHGGRGRALLGKGDAKGAIAPLERAVALLAKHPGFDLERADAQWALARALRKTGRWPDARTRSLAEQARETYATRQQAGEAARDAIDRWLAAP